MMSRYLKSFCLMATTCTGVLFLAFRTTLAAIPTFCAVTVRVVDEDENPLRAVAVELVDPQDRTVERRITANDGTASFCDFGFGQHSVIVDKNAAASVVVRNITLAYGVPRKILVVLNRGITEFALISKHGPLCSAYLRISNDRGEPIAAARVAVGSDTTTVDEFGRVMFGVPIQKDPTPVVISAPGYHKNRLAVPCEKLRSFQREVVLVRK
jgi:hypothetical protein